MVKEKSVTPSRSLEQDLTRCGIAILYWSQVKKVVDCDEHPRPNSTMESLAKLPPVFQKDGTVTAANASVRHLMSC